MTAIVEKLAICAMTAFGLVVALTPAAKALAVHFNIVASPCEESGHPEPTPVLGGVAIVIAVIAALGLVGELPLWMLAGMLALLALGTVDDAVALTPSRKLLAQIAVVAFFLWAAPVAPEVTRWPLVNLGLAGFWMVAAINAFNLVDGLDGLAPGVGIAAMGAVGVVAWWSRDGRWRARRWRPGRRWAASCYSTFIRPRFSWATAARCRWASCWERWRFKEPRCNRIRIFRSRSSRCW